jgi:hypothetical protein
VSAPSVGKQSIRGSKKAHYFFFFFLKIYLVLFMCMSVCLYMYMYTIYQEFGSQMSELLCEVAVN